AEKNIGGDGQGAGEVEFLIDDGDAVGFGVAWMGEADQLAAGEEFPVVVCNGAAEDSHEGRLAGAVFAAGGVDFARQGVDRDVPKGLHAVELFGNVFGGEARSGHQVHASKPTVGRLRTYARSATITRTPSREGRRSRTPPERRRGRRARRAAWRLSWPFRR